jgi:hypothetical protein
MNWACKQNPSPKRHEKDRRRPKGYSMRPSGRSQNPHEEATPSSRLWVGLRPNTCRSTFRTLSDWGVRPRTSSDFSAPIPGNPGVGRRSPQFLFSLLASLQLDPPRTEVEALAWENVDPRGARCHHARKKVNELKKLRKPEIASVPVRHRKSPKLLSSTTAGWTGRLSFQHGQ